MMHRLSVSPVRASRSENTHNIMLCGSPAASKYRKSLHLHNIRQFQKCILKGTVSKGDADDCRCLISTDF